MAQSTKQKIRKDILTRLKRQKEEDRLRKSRDIQRNIEKLPEYQGARTILYYASFAGEVDTHGMMRQAMQDGKQVVLPVVDQETRTIMPHGIERLEEDLEHGPYNIQQPKIRSAIALELSALDLVIVPGLAFDRRNNRLGRGGGYYDRFLKILPSHIPSIGIAFDFQILPRIPVDPHDQPVSRIISNGLE
ncbi:MAG: 5-formyltetrahydrofolate cyclo-ligase [Candidatus Omnitrophota bacterium]